MERIKVETSNKYEVLIGKGLLNRAGELILDVLPKSKVAIISDDKVFSLYGKMLEKSLKESGFEIVSFTFPNGEQSKTAETYLDMLEFLAENHLTRSDIVVALGGGVVGDMAGFAAGTYLRGIKFVQIPTTLLAAVDSSVGGKTGINLNAGKNLAGVFHQPALVICDTDTLATLDEKTYNDGVSESIKYGMIADEALFYELGGDFKNNIEKIIARCVSIKRDVVSEDEFETGIRKFLNFGHTIGHAIEKCSNFEITHGHSVAIGMAMVTKAAEMNGTCKMGTYNKLTELLTKCGLPISCPYDAEELYKVALSDKKRSGNSVTLVLPLEIGKCELKKVSKEELMEYIKKGL